MSLHSDTDFVLLEWFDDIVHAAHVKSLHNVVRLVPGGDKYYRNVRCFGVGFQTSARLKTVNPLHNNVQQDQVWCCASGDLQSDLPAGSAKYLIAFWLQGFTQQIEIRRNIVNNKNRCLYLIFIHFSFLSN